MKKMLIPFLKEIEVYNYSDLDNKTKTKVLKNYLNKNPKVFLDGNNIISSFYKENLSHIIKDLQIDFNTEIDTTMVFLSGAIKEDFIKENLQNWDILKDYEFFIKNSNINFLIKDYKKFNCHSADLCLIESEKLRKIIQKIISSFTTSKKYKEIILLNAKNYCLNNPESIYLKDISSPMYDKNGNRLEDLLKPFFQSIEDEKALSDIFYKHYNDDGYNF